MLDTVKNAFKVKEIRNKLFFTFVALLVVRLGCALPVPGIRHDLFQGWLASQDGLGFLDTLTGGSFSQLSIFALNISPYITASIIMQLLTIVFPKLEELQKDGASGQKKIAEYSRYLTIALAVIESIALVIGFSNSSYLDGGMKFSNIVIITLSFTAGSAFLMWLGEQITEKGIGNGISIILLINIVASMPNDFHNLIQKFVVNPTAVVNKVLGAIGIVVVVVAIVVLVILLQDAQRKIPVQYAQKVQGRKMVGGQTSNIPLKINTAGVIPVIFAQSLMQFPIIISSFAGYKGTGVWSEILKYLNSGYWCNPSQIKYTVGLLVYIALIVFFAYFYTSITFNPLMIADNMKKQGGFIPGIRPGKPTSDYLNKVLNYIVFIGAIGLTVIAVLPYIFSGVFGASVSFGGTSLIIIVSVVLETMKQVESQMLVRNYKGFLEK